MVGNIDKSDGQVREVPGFYGSLNLEERVIQKIWREQEFLTESLFTDPILQRQFYRSMGPNTMGILKSISIRINGGVTNITKTLILKRSSYRYRFFLQKG
jgi:hypothetical protein